MLGGNALSGTLPPDMLIKLPNLVLFNVSNNPALMGPIPILQTAAQVRRSI